MHVFQCRLWRACVVLTFVLRWVPGQPRESMGGLGCSLRLWYTSVGPLGRGINHQRLDSLAELAHGHLRVECSQALFDQTAYGAAHLSILRSSQREEFAVLGSHSTLTIRLPQHSYNYK